MLRYLFKCFAIEFDSQEIFIESKKINLNMLKLQLNVSNQPSNKWCKYSQREEKNTISLSFTKSFRRKQQLITTSRNWRQKKSFRKKVPKFERIVCNKKNVKFENVMHSTPSKRNC